MATAAIGIATTIDQTARRAIAAGAITFFLGAVANCCSGCFTVCCIKSVIPGSHGYISPMGGTLAAFLLTSSLAAGVSCGLTDNVLHNIGITWAVPAATAIVACYCGLFAACLREVSPQVAYVLPTTREDIPGSYMRLHPQA
jgi:Na+/phosphate symporter